MSGVSYVYVLYNMCIVSFFQILSHMTTTKRYLKSFATKVHG